MWNRFFEQARYAIFQAQVAAQTRGLSIVGPVEIAVGVITQPKMNKNKVWPPRPMSINGDTNVSIELLNKLNVDVSGLRNELLQSPVFDNEANLSKDMKLTASGKSVIERSYKASRHFQSEHISTAHLLFGILMFDDPIAAKIIKAKSVTIESLKDAYYKFEITEKYDTPQVNVQKKPFWKRLLGT
jgi:ATP-dependent Clp protease ATP-binding subunit ClpA